MPLTSERNSCRLKRVSAAIFQKIKEKVLEAARIRCRVWLSINLKTSLIHFDVTEQWLIYTWPRNIHPYLAFCADRWGVTSALPISLNLFF